MQRFFFADNDTGNDLARIRFARMSRCQALRSVTLGTLESPTLAREPKAGAHRSPEPLHFSVGRCVDPSDLAEGARLENDSGDSHRAASKHFFAQSVQRLP